MTRFLRSISCEHHSMQWCGDVTSLVCDVLRHGSCRSVSESQAGSIKRCASAKIPSSAMLSCYFHPPALVSMDMKQQAIKRSKKPAPGIAARVQIVQGWNIGHPRSVLGAWRNVLTWQVVRFTPPFQCQSARSAASSFPHSQSSPSTMSLSSWTKKDKDVPSVTNNLFCFFFGVAVRPW